MASAIQKSPPDSDVFLFSALVLLRYYSLRMAVGTVQLPFITADLQRMTRIPCRTTWAVLLGSSIAFMFAVRVHGADPTEPTRIPPAREGLLATEKLVGEGAWVDPRFERFSRRMRRLRVTVWFDDQFLGDGRAYRRRAIEFAGARRGPLRAKVVKTLKAVSDRSYQAAKIDLDKLADGGKISQLERHWIINGFSCVITPEALEGLKAVKGARKIFVSGAGGTTRRGNAVEAAAFKPTPRPTFDPRRYRHPWYTRYLMADKVWQDFEVSGRGTLNIVHDSNFVFSDNVAASLYRNPGEVPGNHKDDDGNGLVDDFHGYDFDRKSPNLTVLQVPLRAARPQGMHGFMCAAIICGAGVEGGRYEFGIAPEASWAGVIASRRLEAAVEWAVDHEADTYSMSFSIPGLGDYRSHWRKVMEHGSFCGVYFVSGAGNFARTAMIPVQMRTPEDIPDVVFAAAGVQRNFARTPFSSKGPVKWATEHYRDGTVAKPEVCAFNMGLPMLLRDGSVRNSGLSGNSFAGPMFCGSIALMLSADPDLLPWDLRQIITTTATDVSGKGVDNETGHGLINCYRAVREVLRRRAIRDDKDPKPYEGRTPGDELDIKALRTRLASTRLKVARLQAGSQAARLGLKPGDVIERYNGKQITSQVDLQQAKKAAAKLETVPLVVRRAGKTIELKVKPGPLGFTAAVEFDEPTFR